MADAAEDRTKESPEYTFDDIAKYFHLPINDASQSLGICTTLLKKICRKNDISRWPHRKIKSINRLIDDFERLAQNKPEDLDIINEQIKELQDKRDYLLQHPNVSYHTVIPKYNVNSYNARIRQKDEPHSTLRKPKPNKTIDKPNFTRYPRRSSRRTNSTYSTASTYCNEIPVCPSDSVEKQPLVLGDSFLEQELSLHYTQLQVEL